jgi:hypothetical protein
MFHPKAPGYLIGRLAVIGPYKIGTCGGCDRISRQDWVEAAIRSALRQADVVVFEGIIQTGIWGRWFRFSHWLRVWQAKYGRPQEGMTWAFMDTPREVCYNRVLQRNGGKPFNRANLDNKYDAARSIRLKAQLMGETVRAIHWESAEADLRRLLA